MGQSIDQFIGQTIGEVLLIAVRTEIYEREDCERLSHRLNGLPATSPRQRGGCEHEEYESGDEPGAVPALCSLWRYLRFDLCDQAKSLTGNGFDVAGFLGGVGQCLAQLANAGRQDIIADVLSRPDGGEQVVS